MWRNHEICRTHIMFWTLTLDFSCTAGEIICWTKIRFFPNFSFVFRVFRCFCMFFVFLSSGSIIGFSNVPQFFKYFQFSRDSSTLVVLLKWKINFSYLGDFYWFFDWISLGSNIWSISCWFRWRIKFLENFLVSCTCLCFRYILSVWDKKKTNIWAFIKI